VLTVLWAGSLWSTIWVAASLFNLQSDRHLAGLIAARLFSIETYLGLGVAALAIVLPGRSRYRWAYFAVAVLAMNEWILKRVMSLARAHGTAAGLGFGAWHGVSAALYVLACLAVLLLVWKEDFR
jgi:bacteriorhodopsin